MNTNYTGTIRLAISDIRPSPTNPRQIFDESGLTELAESIAAHGLLQPILVRPWPESYTTDGPAPKYELVAGERRWRAANLAGLTEIDAQVRDLGTKEVLEMQIIENLQRRDLHPLEEAIGYERMMREYGYTAKELAKKIGKSKAYVYASVKLTALCDEARKIFYDGLLNPSTALLIARIPNETLQVRAATEITASNWEGNAMSVRSAQRYLQNKYMLQLDDAPFPTDDKMLITSAGSCDDCPKRTGNQPAALFDDVSSADVCIDPDCFAEKRTAHVAAVAKSYLEKGKTVITGEEANKLIAYGEHLSYGCGLTNLDQKCWDDKQGRTFREILAGHDVETQLVESKKGTLIEVAKEDDIDQVLQASGIVEDRSKEESERSARLDAENAYRQRLFDANHASNAQRFASTPALSRTELSIIARAMIGHIFPYGYKRKILKENFPREKFGGIRDIYTKIEKMDAAGLSTLLLDCCYGPELTAEIQWVGISPSADFGEPRSLLESSAINGLEPAEFREEGEKNKTDACQPEAARKEKPAALETTDDVPNLSVGDTVTIRADLIGTKGKPRACAGKTGTIHELAGEELTVKINDGPNGLAWGLKPGDVTRTDPIEEDADVPQ